MQQDKVNLFLASNAGKFRVSDLSEIKLTLEKMDETQYAILTGTNYMDPTLILVIAILLGWDRFFLDDIVLGVLKVLTCYGFGIWWLVDIFTANDRTYDYNFRKFMQMAYMR